jgi:hypothetical protein
MKEAYLSNRTLPDPTAVVALENTAQDPSRKKPEVLFQAEAVYEPTIGQRIGDMQSVKNQLQEMFKQGIIGKDEYRRQKGHYKKVLKGLVAINEAEKLKSNTTT